MNIKSAITLTIPPKIWNIIGDLESPMALKIPHKRLYITTDIILSVYILKYLTATSKILCGVFMYFKNIGAKYIPIINLSEEISKCDVVLLGPQVKYVLDKATEIAKPYNVPVEVINMMHYGTCNGKAVLDRAIELANK